MSGIFNNLVYIFKDGKRDEKDEVKFDILQYRDPKSYTRDTIDLIRLVTTNPDVNPVGSQKFKVHKYPGDIDIFEKILECCDLDSATQKIARKIQIIAENIQANIPKTFLGDFKAGLDPRFEINIGKIQEGKVDDYNYTAIIVEINQLYTDKLISDEEYRSLILATKKQPTPLEHEELGNLLRKFYVLRWNLEELINGQKEHRGKIFYLDQAIRDKTIVKIDMWAAPQGRWTEITNFLVLNYMDKNGHEYPINIELEDRISSLIRDIKHYGSKEHRKSLKYAKRLWVYSQVINNKSLLKLLFPLFSSNAGLLNQISSEIETLTFMTERLDDQYLMGAHSYVIHSMREQIDGFKARVNSIFDLDIDDNKIYSLVDLIVDEMYNLPSDQVVNRKLVVELLAEIDDIINKSVEKYANQYLEERGLSNPADIIKQ